MKCQVDYICDCPPAGLEDALANLPNTLDEALQRILRGIKEAKWEFANRLLQFVAVASSMNAVQKRTFHPIYAVKQLTV